WRGRSGLFIGILCWNGDGAPDAAARQLQLQPTGGRIQGLRKAASRAQAASSTNHARLHHGIESPRKVQSIAPQSPVPVSTWRIRLWVSMVSRMNAKGAPQTGIGGGNSCSHTWQPATPIPTAAVEIGRASCRERV